MANQVLGFAMPDISFLTIGLSAAASVCTGYLGVVFNYSRQRQRQRRMYGLSLLAEVKTLQKLSRHYHRQFAEDWPGSSSMRLPKLHFGTADTAVFNNVAGNVGLFSTKTAMLVIEYYGAVRSVATQAEVLIELQNNGELGEPELRDRLADHLRFLRVAHRHGGLVVRSLRRETPTDFDQKMRLCNRRMKGRLRAGAERVTASFRALNVFIKSWKWALAS